MNFDKPKMYVVFNTSFTPSAGDVIEDKEIVFVSSSLLTVRDFIEKENNKSRSQWAPSYDYELVEIR